MAHAAAMMNALRDPPPGRRRALRGGRPADHRVPDRGRRWSRSRLWSTVRGSCSVDCRPAIMLGEMAIFDGGPRSATATAIEDCVLFAIDRTQISERLSKTDPIIRALLEGQVKRYRGAIEAIRGGRRRRSSGPGSSAEISGVDKIRLETHLREALAGEGLDVRYQPILHIASGQIAGYEALLRWNHPDRGSISPMELVGLAEESALIVEVGEYVFDTACSGRPERSSELGADPEPFIAVNVSARQLEHAGPDRADGGADRGRRRSPGQPEGGDHREPGVRPAIGRGRDRALPSPRHSRRAGRLRHRLLAPDRRCTSWASTP